MTRGPTGVPGQTDRGQTTQDFALGMSLFLIAVTFVFAFIPTVFAFTDAGPGSEEVKQAERSSRALLETFTAGERHNDLNGVRTATYFNSTDAADQLRSDLGLPRSARINVTVRAIDDDVVVEALDEHDTNVLLTMGDRYPSNRPAAEVVRIVTIEEADMDCDPACQLVVRVW